MRRAAVALFCLLAAAPAGDAVARKPPGLFSYNRFAPLGFRDLGAVNDPKYPVRVHDISFASPKGGRVTGYLVIPPVKGRKPAIIYMHGAEGNRTEFLIPAGWMAARGVVEHLSRSHLRYAEAVATTTIIFRDLIGSQQTRHRRLM